MSAVQIIQFPEHNDSRGSLAVAEYADLPFPVRRLFWIYDTTGLPRGGHAHKECQQVIVAVHGSFDVTVGTGEEQRTVRLMKPCFGLYIPVDTMVTLDNWRAGAVALVLSSEEFDQEDYIRPRGEPEP